MARSSRLSKTVRGWVLGLAFARRSASAGLAACSIAVVSHISFPSITGEDQPRPGISVFQTMLLVSLHAMGTDLACECPCAVGPRHSGHSDAETRSKQIASRWKRSRHLELSVIAAWE